MTDQFDPQQDWLLHHTVSTPSKERSLVHDMFHLNTNASLNNVKQITGFVGTIELQVFSTITNIDQGSSKLNGCSFLLS